MSKKIIFTYSCCELQLSKDEFRAHVKTVHGVDMGTEVYDLVFQNATVTLTYQATCGPVTFSMTASETRCGEEVKECKATSTPISQEAGQETEGDCVK